MLLNRSQSSLPGGSALMITLSSAGPFQVLCTDPSVARQCGRNREATATPQSPAPGLLGSGFARRSRRAPGAAGRSGAPLQRRAARAHKGAGPHPAAQRAGSLTAPHPPARGARVAQAATPTGPLPPPSWPRRPDEYASRRARPRLLLSVSFPPPGGSEEPRFPRARAGGAGRDRDSAGRAVSERKRKPERRLRWRRTRPGAQGCAAGLVAVPGQPRRRPGQSEGGEGACARAPVAAPAASAPRSPHPWNSPAKTTIKPSTHAHAQTHAHTHTHTHIPTRTRTRARALDYVQVNRETQSAARARKESWISRLRGCLLFRLDFDLLFFLGENCGRAEITVILNNVRLLPDCLKKKKKLTKHKKRYQNNP
jgi:hypothetical protein